MVLGKGNIQFKTVNDLQKEEQDALTEGESFPIRPMLAQLIADTWDKNRRHREVVSDRLLYCLRSRKGEYSAEEKSAILASGGAQDPVYLKLTGTKARAASAWIRDLLLPADSDYPFTVLPTPEPDIEPRLKDEILKSATTKAAALQQKMDSALEPEELVQFRQEFYDGIMAIMQQYAENAAMNMENRIKDKKAEGNWVKALEDFIEDFVTYPVAVLKGPFYNYKRTLKWENGEPKATEEATMVWERRSPFDIYPAPYQDSLQKGDIIDKIQLTKKDLYNLIGPHGYDEEKIREVLRNCDYSTVALADFDEWQREQLESSSYFYNADNGMLTGYHFWGSVPGKSLREWGVIYSDLDDEKYYEVDAILIGDTVIRAVINDDPLGRRPYHAACWDSIPGSFYGIALPEQMEEHQRIVNTAARSIVENMALSSGAQVTVFVDQLPPGEQLTTIMPKKIWQVRAPLAGNGSTKPIDFFVPPSVAPELMGILEAFENKSDDVTNVPRYSYGNEKIGGAGSTATGLGMLMSSAAKGIRRALSQIDTYVIKPIVHQTFTQLMLYDPDPKIKGDIKIVAKGSTAVLIKENEQQRMLAFLRELAPFVGPATIEKLSSEIATSMNLDLDKELRADSAMRQQAMAQQQAAQEAESVAAQAQTNSAETQSQNQASMVQ